MVVVKRPTNDGLIHQRIVGPKGAVCGGSRWCYQKRLGRHRCSQAPPQSHAAAHECGGGWDSCRAQRTWDTSSRANTGLTQLLTAVCAASNSETHSIQYTGAKIRPITGVWHTQSSREGETNRPAPAASVWSPPVRRGKLTAKQNRQLHQIIVRAKRILENQQIPRARRNKAHHVRRAWLACEGTQTSTGRRTLLPLQGPFLFWWCSRGAATS